MDIAQKVFAYAPNPLFVSVATNDMGNFKAFNAVYRRFLGNGPPSRAVVQEVAKADGFSVSALYGVEKDDRKSLHIQSISRWAPACIGPYSQGVAYRGLVWISGQIPLVPETMVLGQSQSPADCVKHLNAVATSMGCKGTNALVFCKLYYTSKEEVPKVELPKNCLCLKLKAARLPRDAEYEIVSVCETGSLSYEKQMVSFGPGVEVEMCKSNQKDLVFALARFKTQADREAVSVHSIVDKIEGGKLVYEQEHLNDELFATVELWIEKN